MPTRGNPLVHISPRSASTGPKQESYRHPYLVIQQAESNSQHRGSQFPEWRAELPTQYVMWVSGIHHESVPDKPDHLTVPKPPMNIGDDAVTAASSPVTKVPRRMRSCIPSVPTAYAKKAEGASKAALQIPRLPSPIGRDAAPNLHQRRFNIRIKWNSCKKRLPKQSDISSI